MSLRFDLVIVILLGAAAGVVAVIGEATSLGAIAELVHYNPAPQDVHLIRAHEAMRKLYDYWYYLRFAAILLTFLALHALARVLKRGGDKVDPGAPGIR